MMILALCTIVLFVIVASLIEAWLAKARKAKSEVDTLPSGPEASQRSVEKTASASLTSMVESHYGVSNLEVDWFGAAAGGVPPFDGLYSCRYDTGRRRNNGVLRVRNHRVWLYGPDGCEEERHGH